MLLTSSVLQPGQPVPVRYTADGQDLSPPLEWTGVPAGARSLAILCDDPDAPRGDWVHWVLYNLDPGLLGLDEGHLGGLPGCNDFGKTGYNGPSPPRGKTHRYVFHLYALDTALNLPANAGKAHLLKAMEGHVLARAELTATYRRS